MSPGDNEARSSSLNPRNGKLGKPGLPLSRRLHVWPYIDLIPGRDQEWSLGRPAQVDNVQ